MRIFGKKSADPLLDERLEIMRSSYPHLAKNVEIDDRVSLERIKYFTESVRDILLTKGLEPALARYAGEVVRALPEETYLSRSANSLNLAVERDSYPEFLGHIINVNSLARYMAQEDLGSRYGYPQLNPQAASDIPSTGLEGIDQVLVAELSAEAGPQRRSAFIDVILRYHGDLALWNQLRPVWTAEWSRFENAALANDEPDRWASLVGAYRRPGTWLLPLKYRSSEVGVLVRPTQLDAGSYDHHFPSPASADCKGGGYCMNLVEPDPVEAVSEFVHRPIRFNLGHWEAAGGRLGPQVNENAHSLSATRGRHLEVLKRMFGTVVIESWWGVEK